MPGERRGPEEKRAVEDDLAERLSLVRLALERSREPLHVPLGVDFRPLDGEAHLAAWADHAARAVRGETFAPATLYVHVPFCARVCTYCLLSAVRTPGKEKLDAYVEALRRQIALYEPAVRGLRFGSLHVGGGTPTLLDERQLHALFGDLARLPLRDGAQIGVEAHPGTSTPGRLAVLAQHGVHRVSFGVESLTPEVLRNVNREDQNETRVRAAVAEARRLGMSVNVDLLAGLPGETAETWEATVRGTLVLEPDSMSVNRFLGENSALAGFGFDPSEAENRRVDAMLLRADALVRELSAPRWPEEPLRTAGFGTQYVWDRSPGARRYFQDDMIGPVSTLALGHGALGHLYGRHWSVTAGAVDDTVASLAQGRPPAMLASSLDARFEKAFFASDRAARGALSGRVYQEVFGEPVGAEFRREIRFLVEQGLLAVDGDRLSKPPHLDFQVTHLLAFLLGGEETLRTALAGLAPDAIVREPGVDADEATRRAQATRAKTDGALTVHDDGRRALRQYEHIGELTPSMLWVRIAIRAARAGRGEARRA
ncbi:MAG TPA: radical SAM protein [Polyangiaceae bacterium]|jgi:oxygen-independent coproporphyrinogen-3 oxidase